MKIAFILAALVVIFLFGAPVAGSLNKISASAPIYIGESDVDISSALNGCHTIAWWQEGKNINSDPVGKNITLFPINTASDVIYHYTFSPDVFTGYEGTWYCQDKSPNFPVFRLSEPNISLKIWDLDTKTEVSGQSVPFGTNITYRIDTNLGAALNYANRPNENPSDSFYTVTMTDPRGRVVSNLYTGNAGNANTVILPFDVHPFITTTPYYGKNMNVWYHPARDPQGTQVYPAGTYTFSVSANLNNMVSAFGSSALTDTEGKITDSNTVTLIQQATITAMPTTRQPPAGQTTAIGSPTTPPVTPPTTSPVAKKTTYSPLPVWISLAALFGAGLVILVRK